MHAPSALSVARVLLAAALAALTFPASAAVLLNDQFLDGAITNGTDPGEIDTAYFTNRDATTLTIVQDSTTGPDEGAPDNALNFATTGTFRGFLGEFALTTISVGDTITLNFDIRYVTDPTAEIRLGLYNTSGTSVTANNSLTDRDDYGYRISFNGTTGSAAGTNLQAELPDNGAGGEIGLGTTRGVSTNSVSDFTAFGTTSQNISLAITRTATGTNVINLLVNGTTRGTFTDSATGSGNGNSPIFAFNEVFFTPTGTANEVRFDNINVSVVPEPGSAVMLLGGLGMLALRRRRVS